MIKSLKSKLSKKEKDVLRVVCDLLENSSATEIEFRLGKYKMKVIREVV